jgi:hypothetical protein
MAAFTGTLNTNKVFAALYNQIISMQVFGTGISDLSGIYGSRKVDGTLYGDTKLYVSTDVLASYEFDGTDSPGSYNLLTIKRPPAPKINKVVIDTYRQIPVTVDDYFTKQAFSGEGAFSDFNGVVLSWLTKTKDVYEHTKFTADIITSALGSATLLQTIALAAPSGVEGYDLIRWRAQEFFRQLEDAIAELEEPSRSFNDNGFLRNYKLEDFDIVVPRGILSTVKKNDIPFLFNPDQKIDVKEVHWKYFGTKNESSGTTAASNTTVRSLIETDYSTTHVFPGDLLPDDTAYDADVTYTCTYTSRPDISAAFNAVLVHKQDFPIMSAFSVGTSFFNARRLDQNNYLTFGHNDVAASHIGEYALLKVTTTVS